MTQFASAALPVLDADPEAPIRAARTDAMIRKNRAIAPPDVADLREKPRLSIAELNQIDLDDLRERYFEDARDARPPVIKALDLVDLPRNTIANIAFGKPEATLDEIQAAAKAAAAHDFIISFPDGYNTSRRRARNQVSSSVASLTPWPLLQPAPRTCS